MSDGEILSCDLATCVDAARRRLGRLVVRDAARRYIGPILLAAGLGAMARPIFLPVRDGSPYAGLTFALCLAVGATTIALAIVVVRGWRSRPTALASARRLDTELGLAEVVASGFSFESDRRTDEMALFAIERARRAVTGIDLGRLLVPTTRPRSAREKKWLKLGAAALIVGLAVGAIDRNVVERVLHPPTTREVQAAAALERAIETAANRPEAISPEQKRAAERVVEAARRASKAAERGDRRGAREALDDMRQATRSFEDIGREQARSLRAVRDALEAKGDGRAGGEGAESGRPSASASEALAKLKEELDRTGGDKESLRKAVERLERAASSAARSADARGRSPSERSAAASSAAMSRVAAALKEAQEAAARGDVDAARRAMDRAERTLSEMESASRAASSGMLARMSEEASALDRSMRAAMRGSSKEGEGEGEQSASAGAKGEKSGKETANKGDPSGAPGTGPGEGERTPGAEARRVNVEGNLQARTDVRAGERAVSAIQGVGRGGDPKAYAEIFPSYDTVVEDGLREDMVPAARRGAVRRYFTSIRPGSDTDESRK